MPLAGAGVVSISFEGDASDLIESSNEVIKAIDKQKEAVKKAGAEIEAAAKKEQAAIEKTAQKYSGSLAPGLQKAQEAVSKFMSANSALIGVTVAVGAAAVKSYQAFQQYAGAVRDVALASGSSAEEASRLLQVLDDYEITAQDVMAATKAMTKQGLEPSIDTLATLADQYVKINDPMKQNEFILKNLGKAGLQWANALSQGGDALRKASDEVNKNLVLTDEQIKKAEMARLAVDAWADAWEGFKVSVGSAIGSMIAANAEAENLRASYAELGNTEIHTTIQAERFEAFIGQMKRGAAMTEFYKNQYSDMAKSVIDNTAEMQKARADEISSAISIQKANDSYNKSQDKITQSLEKEQEKLDKLNQGYYAYTGANAEAATELANITNKINAFIPGVTGSQQELHKMMETQKLLNGMLKDEEPVLVKNTEEIEKQKEVVNELQEAQRTAAEEFGAAQTEKLTMLALEKIAMQDGVAGYSEAEAEKARLLLDTAGIAEESALRQSLAFDQVSSSIANGSTKAAELKKILDIMQKGYTIDVAINLSNNLAMGSMASSGYGSMLAGNAASTGNPLGNASTQALDKWRGGTVGSFAGGGKGGGWGIVGDRQGGGWVDGVSELVYGNFKVFPSKQAKGMLKSGMLGKVPGFAFGGNSEDFGGMTGGAAVKIPYVPTPAPLSKSGGGGSPIASAMQAIEFQAADMQASTQSAVVQMAQVTQQMTQQILQSNAQTQDELQRIAGILLHENPNAVGSAVAYKVALKSA